jgi:hypothetical protein
VVALCGDLTDYGTVEEARVLAKELAPLKLPKLRYAEPAIVMGQPVRLCPAEETIWSKAFVMERERYDGADIAHLLRARAEMLDWRRLTRRFGRHWRVLFGGATG